MDDTECAQTCCDCGSLSPQWASVPLGILMCLECAGQHRGLGVHVSFVRSVQMDSWRDNQIRAMMVRFPGGANLRLPRHFVKSHAQVGGNRSMRDFFRRHGMLSEPIQNKYNSAAAAYYRARCVFVRARPRQLLPDDAASLDHGSIAALRDDQPPPDESTIPSYEARATWPPRASSGSDSPIRSVSSTSSAGGSTRVVGAGRVAEGATAEETAARVHEAMRSGVGSSSSSSSSGSAAGIATDDFGDVLADSAAKASKVASETWSYLSTAVSETSKVVSAKVRFRSYFGKLQQ